MQGAHPRVVMTFATGGIAFTLFVFLCLGGVRISFPPSAKCGEHSLSHTMLSTFGIPNATCRQTEGHRPLMSVEGAGQ
jgi:hypothetical protein